MNTSNNSNLLSTALTEHSRNCKSSFIHSLRIANYYNQLFNATVTNAATPPVSKNDPIKLGQFRAFVNGLDVEDKNILNRTSASYKVVVKLKQIHDFAKSVAIIPFAVALAFYAAYHLLASDLSLPLQLIDSLYNASYWGLSVYLYSFVFGALCVFLKAAFAQNA